MVVTVTVEDVFGNLIVEVVFFEGDDPFVRGDVGELWM